MVEKIVNYEMVVGENWVEVSESVRKFIDKGWQPLGGVSMMAARNSPYPDTKLFIRFAQAMVKYESEA